ncbi:MAG: AraC family transcriptional regulator [Cytophagales bacterium]|nr:MAG: AraC family transcriptional regulator [Cytophagales bacterium]
MQHIKKYQFKAEKKLQVEIVDLENLCQTAKDFLLVPHRTNFYHIFLFEACQISHSVDFQSLDTQPNTLLFLSKDKVHQFDKNLAYKGKVLIFTAEFYCQSAHDKRFLESSILFHDFFENLHFSIAEQMPVFTAICRQIDEELQQPTDDIQQALLKNYVHHFLLLAERHKRKQGFKEIQKDANFEYLLLFKDLLEQNFVQLKKVSQYTEKLCITEKRLHQATHNVLGKTPKQMIDERILLEAKRLLIHETHSIKEIAYELGFDEPTNFIKYFKKHTQKTPIEFRNHYYNHLM